MSPHALGCLVAFLSAIVTVVAQLYVPILIGRAIDLMVGSSQVDLTALMALLVRLVVTVVVAAAFQWLQGYATNRLSYEVVRDLRVLSFDKIRSLPLSTIDTHAHGDLISRVVNDVDQVGDGLIQGLTQLFGGTVTIVGTLVFMVSISPVMALVVALVTPVSVLVASLIAHLSHKSFAEQQRLQGDLGGYAEEMITNQRLVSAFAYSSRAERDFSRRNDDLYVAGERAQFTSSLSNPCTRFVNNLIYAVVAVVGFMCVITGVPAPLTVGGVQSFLSYANQYTKPFNEITAVLTQIQTAFASARRLIALIDAPEEDPDSPGAICLDHVRGDIEFEDVVFSYDPPRPLLRDIEFHVRPGQKVALVGRTGCGKTTLVNLLLRFYEADAGTIRIDGCDVDTVTRASLRRSFGMVLQDTWLFEGTVRDNIAYGRPDASDEEVIAAAREAMAWPFIERLERGLDTHVGPAGGGLSEGQRQLLCISRVMLEDPPILLLDEATSSIDSRTEAIVQAAFDRMVASRTSLVVAHRLSTVRNADLILVLSDGVIAEQGTHDELLARDGVYAGIYKSQFAEVDVR
jgi:ATP-binding cassette subfamily B protein